MINDCCKRHTSVAFLLFLFVKTVLLAELIILELNYSILNKNTGYPQTL